MAQAAELLPVKFAYQIPTTPQNLYSYVSRPVFLEDWFADEVEIEEENGETFYVFSMDGETYKAKLIDKVPNRIIKLRWVEHPTKRGHNLIFQVSESKTDEGYSNLFVYDSCNQLKIKIVEQYWEQQIRKLLDEIE